VPAQGASSWGFWTERKLAILERYLPAFTTASSSVSARIYIDAFAGQGRGVSRTTGEEFDASASIALRTRPPFTHLRFCELPTRATELRQQLQRAFPHRIADFEVVEGDCNATIPRILKQLRDQDLRWAPTFAFLDPYGMQVDFRTLRALAEHKLGYRSSYSAKPTYKVELWLLFPSAATQRVTAADSRRGALPDEARMTKVLGTTAWHAIHTLRVEGKLSGAQAREEYVNLMRWMLETKLSYRWTHPLRVEDLRRRPVYHMILATDNEAGTKIMSDIYSKAAAENPELYDQAFQELTGQFRLIPVSDVAPIEKYRYTYSPPLPPLDEKGRRVEST
jgi:three-Cys-motif partner protein